MTCRSQFRLFILVSLLVLVNTTVVYGQTSRPSSDENFQYIYERDFTQWDFFNVASLNPMQSIGGSADPWLMESIGSVEEPDAFSELSKIYYFQNTAPLTVSVEESEDFKVRIGNVTSVYLVPESHSLETRWNITVKQMFLDGTDDVAAIDILQSGESMYASVLPDSIIEISVVQETSPGDYPKQLWMTIVPDNEVLAYIQSAIHGTPILLHQ